MWKHEKLLKLPVLDTYSYNPDDWKGIESISDKTRGLTLLKKSGHSRLYRIDLE